MTNEEAIKTLKLMQSQVEWDYPMDYAAAIDEVISALEAQEWIPVNKKSHPDTPERVQVQLDNGWIITAYYDDGEWFSVPDCGDPIEDRWMIEAWRPLSESYKEEETT